MFAFVDSQYRIRVGIKSSAKIFCFTTGGSGRWRHAN